ncbi:MAG: arginine N-succinyltransferase [Gammaproteobacteria bacterium]|nr:arginine N-succinyltransferase [Gammaproteobacteria bacterium]NNJ98674.1 arginine N-succinyltransferase [Gammaproteobacteria bacterium]
MTTDDKQLGSQPSAREFTVWHLSTFILLAVLLTLVGFWIFKSVLFPSEFTPVTLNAKEQQVLEQKLEKFERIQSQADRRAARSRPFSQSPETELTPEPYSEEGASREIRLSEKELNALLAKNTDLATRLAIDLSSNLASAKLLVHLDEDFPLLGGNTVKLTAGAELAFATGKPIVKLKGISVWGVPLPNAWLGGIKNVDLVQEFGQEPGFWQAFAEGVELVEVKQGHLLIKLKP